MITLRTWFAVAAILYLGFGIGLLVVPAPFMSTYGVELDGGGQLMARILGSALASQAIMFWLFRAASPPTVTPVLATGLIYNVVDLMVVLAATLSGTMNAMGWGPVALHIFLAAGFGYFTMVARSSQPAAA
ncbi:MAG: hypothetical protein JJ913_04440 [Rhizobiaceae bacterium]|nr:hypothetical protein [Rhizobiaceae bacterium]